MWRQICPCGCGSPGGAGSFFVLWGGGAGWGGCDFVAWGGAAGLMRLWREMREKKTPEERMLSLTAFSFSAFAAGAVGGALGCGYTRLLHRMLPAPGYYSVTW